MAYSKRLTAPSKTNKYWLHTSAGGLNSCILIGGGSVLPNCVGYAWGRAYELMKKKPKLSRGNAEDWYNYKDGYTRSKKPRVGSVICWRGGQTGNAYDGAGHVGIVEEVAKDGTITVSQSDYGGTRFYTSKIKPPYHLYNVGLTFQGFIYLPGIDISSPKPSKPSNSGTVLNSKPSDFVKENATFYPNCTIKIREAPSTKGKDTGLVYKKGMHVNYDGYVRREGYVWISWISASTKKRRWMAAGELNSKGINTNPYGSFK